MSLLGVDIGTSGCKSVVYSEKGDCLASEYKAYEPIFSQPGLCEFDSSKLLNKILETIKDVVSTAVSVNNPVTALCAGSFSEAVVPIDQNGSILGRSIAGSDNRHKEVVSCLEEMGSYNFYKINPNILSFTYTFPKLAWYRDAQPDIFDKTWKYLNWSDFLSYYLTGIPVTAYSHASRTLLFDLENEKWSDTLLEKCELPKNKMAEPVPGGVVIGKVKSEIAKNLGLGRDVLVVSGGHDQTMNAVGAGAIEGGQTVTGIGTFECSTLVFDSIPDTDKLFSMNLSIEHHAVPGKYVTLIYNQAGSLVEWFIKVFAKDLIEKGLKKTDIINRLTGEAGLSNAELIFLPLIEPSGAPYFTEGMAGSFLGITASTDRGDMFKALLEGESMYFIETFNKLDDADLSVKEITATGGGSKSNLWLQIKADLLKRPVKRVSSLETGTVGGALIAGVAAGEFRDLKQAVSLFTSKTKVFLPDKESSVRYGKKIDKYMRLFENYV